MRIWIDTAGLATAEALFGLPPLARHLRALRRLKPQPTEVVLSGPAVPGTIPGMEDGAGLNLVRREEDGPASARLRRALAGDEAGPLLALDGATAVDPRLLAFLARQDGPRAAFGETGDRRGAALLLQPGEAEALPATAPDVLAAAEALVDAGRVPVLDPEDFPGFVVKLRRSLPFWIFAVPDAAARAEIERWLFWSNYKGSTDFLTRWVYPPVVWPLVRLCTRLRIHPNWISAISVVLAFAAVPFFAAGDFVTGLAIAYAMTVLDSVDGKVARLTLTESALGDVLDHGLDIVHPPLWYGAWAVGLGAGSLAHPLGLAAAWLVAFYVADRIVLGIAKARFGRGLHAMTALDGAVRTWIARRNVNMVILTVALLLGQGPAGLVTVAVWQGVTLAWHTLRTLTLRPGDAGKATQGG
jgi:phosphatidylglycerophosphate synthase